MISLYSIILIDILLLVLHQFDIVLVLVLALVSCSFSAITFLGFMTREDYSKKASYVLGAAVAIDIFTAMTLLVLPEFEVYGAIKAVSLIFLTAEVLK